MTVLGFTNKYICQWLGFRIFKTVDKGQVLNYGLFLGIMPLTGWKTDYKTFIKRKKIILWSK